MIHAFRALCDINQTGKLNSEQFSLAMWLVDRKKKGIEPPQILAPEMIPPSLRPNLEVQEPAKPIYTNPELVMISKEIEELAKERRILESEVAQKEADIRIKSGEVRSLQVGYVNNKVIRHYSHFCCRVNWIR